VPLRVGPTAVGGFGLLHERPAAFDDSDVLVAETLAGLAASGVLSGRVLDRTQATVVQLQHALDSRIVIEQAKGLVAGRAGVAPSVAFELLRAYARRHGHKLQQICTELIDGDLAVAALEVPPAPDGPSSMSLA
jgi:ANTAR domain